MALAHLRSIIAAPPSIGEGLPQPSRGARERRHVVTALLAGREEAIKTLFDAVIALGYRIDVPMLTCDPAEAERRNQARGVDCISAYYAQGHPLAWLIAPHRTLSVFKSKREAP